MFSSKSKDKDSPAAAMPAAQISSQGKRPLRTSAAPSIISADLKVTGTLESTGDIQIDGQVEGDVKSAGLVIGEKAFIHGDIVAEEVTIRGRVQGGIRAHKVLLASTCHVEGNILHEAFAVETGAFFEGNCRHADNPLADESPRKPAVEERRPVTPPPSAAPATPISPVTSRPMATSGTATYSPLKS
jgi:cytoskeletal protein CcmA (bactofilin family)